MHGDADPGMENRLEAFAGLWVSEYAPGQSRPVEAAVLGDVEKWLAAGRDRPPIGERSGLERDERRAAYKESLQDHGNPRVE